MPVIVYKTMTIELFYAQGRRIQCEHCQQPFCYVTGGVQSAQTTGVPIVSSDDGMRQTALNQAISGLRKTAKKRKAGQAMCPHCQCCQSRPRGRSGGFWLRGRGLLPLRCAEGATVSVL